MSSRQFRQNETVDFVVVGSGAAGGVIARELSRAGFTVLVCGAYDSFSTRSIARRAPWSGSCSTRL